MIFKYFKQNKLLSPLGQSEGVLLPIKRFFGVHTQNDKLHTAFTLAEVLITLGIIGVVAAMTIPIVINKSQEMEYKTAYKKAFSDFSNAFSKEIADNSLTARTAKSDPVASDSEWKALKGYFKIVTDCDTYAKLYTCWADADRIYYSSFPHSAASLSFVDSAGRSWVQYSLNENIYLVDTNGLKAPNIFGKDRWIFTLRNADNTRTLVGLPEKVGAYSGFDGATITDKTTSTGGWCNYPPCYYYSWLYN